MDFTVSPLNMSTWFKQVVVRRKRAEIASLIAELAKSYNSENPVVMPFLEFPSNIVSSDEEDFEIYTGKRKNSFPRDTSPSSESTPTKIRKNEKSNFPTLPKNKENVQSFLDDWVDLRNAQSSSGPFRLSSNFENDGDGMDDQEKNDLSNTHNVSDDEAEKSVEFMSEYDTTNEISLLKTPKNKSSNVRKISLIKENFSGTKSHIFQKSSIFSTDSDSKVSIARPKRERQPKPNEEFMKKLEAKFQERKKKKDKKRAEDSKKANTSWIDESVFEPTGSNVFSVYNADVSITL